MFRKEAQIKPSANIKSSERRKLLAKVCKTYNIEQENLEKEDELKLLPSIIKQSSFKTHQGISGTLYLDDKELPVWFKTRDSDIIPTLFSSWNYPDLLPLVRTHPHVIEVLQNGANLMLPGTVPPFDSRLRKNAIVGVVDNLNKNVVKAIGICKLDLFTYTSVLNKQGVAVEILHTVGDELHNLNKIVKVSMPSSLELTSNAKDQEEESNPNPVAEIENIQIENDNDSNLQEEPFANSAERLEELPVELIDELFMKSFLQTVYIGGLELPLSSSNFMSNSIYKNLPIVDSKYCNIKRTSWKKTAKFLKHLEKEGYIQCKGKNDNVSIISFISKDNPIIRDFVPHRTIASTNKSKSETKSVTAPKKDKSNEMSIKILYKATSKSRPIFEVTNAEYSKVYTRPSLKEILDTYCNQRELVDKKNPKKFVLDDNLKSVCNLALGSYPREEVFKAFIKNFSQLFAILNPDEELTPKTILHRGEPPKIQIVTEVRIGRKIVTRVSNFEIYNINPQLLANELRVKCSGSTTISSMVSNPKITEVTVQGPHGKIITNTLNSHGIPTAYITFEDKSKKKKAK